MNTYTCEEMAEMRGRYPDLDAYEAWKAAGCPIPATNWPDDPPQLKPTQAHKPLYHPANIPLTADVLLALPLRGRSTSRGSGNVLNRQAIKSARRYRDGR